MNGLQENAREGGERGRSVTRRGNRRPRRSDAPEGFSFSRGALWTISSIGVVLIIIFAYLKLSKTVSVQVYTPDKISRLQTDLNAVIIEVQAVAEQINKLKEKSKSNENATAATKLVLERQGKALEVVETEMGAMQTVMDFMKQAINDQNSVINKQNARINEQGVKLDNVQVSFTAALGDIKRSFESQLKEAMASITKSSANQIKQLLDAPAAGVAAIPRESINMLSNNKDDWSRWSLGSRINYKFTSKRKNESFKNFLLNVPISLFFPYEYSLKLQPLSKPADTVIGGPDAAKLGCVSSNDLIAGCCYSFDGTRGNITINLPELISVSSVRIEAPTVSPLPTAAPKTLAIYVDAACSKGDEACWNSLKPLSGPPSLFIGQFVFDYPSISSQTYHFNSGAEGERATRRVRFEILENHGHKEYTSVYQLRVYGDLINYLHPDTKFNSRNAEL